MTSVCCINNFVVIMLLLMTFKTINKWCNLGKAQEMCATLNTRLY